MHRQLARSRFALVAIALMLTLPAAGLLAVEKGAAADVTLKGEVLDMACYLSSGAKGPDHMKCAQKCAEMGQPIGLLSQDGKVYLLVADHADQSAFEQAKKLAGQQVTIMGVVAGRDGMDALTVHQVKKS